VANCVFTVVNVRQELRRLKCSVRISQSKSLLVEFIPVSGSCIVLVKCCCFLKMMTKNPSVMSVQQARDLGGDYIFQLC